MPTSPSIPEIASALAPRLPQQRSAASNRVLCLILHARPGERAGIRTKTLSRGAAPGNQGAGVNGSRGPRALAEAFLRFSPRVQVREPNLIFIDVTSTAHFFRKERPQVEQLSRPERPQAGQPSRPERPQVEQPSQPTKPQAGQLAYQTDSSAPESGVLESALRLANELGYDAKAAISDTAAGAQAFAQLGRNFICHPGEERERLQPLSLPLLLHLEGLEPWQNPRALEQIVTFFFMLGFEKIGDLDRFSLTSFQDRWGETGALLWKRMRGLDRHPVSPLLPTEPLTDDLHLDFPISLLSLLLHQTRRSLGFLFARLQGRCLYARRLILRLRCEYSEKRHRIEVEPNSPCRDLNLFLTLLENKLDGVDLENPIRDLEIEVITCPERSQQLDCFEPRDSDGDKLESLFSLLRQSAIRTGRYEIQDAILPERSWTVAGEIASPRHEFGAEGAVAVAARDERSIRPSRPATARVRPRKATRTAARAESSFLRLPSYGAAVMDAPRPTRLLKVPRRLPIQELQKLQTLTDQPIERLEEAWWENGESRDYFFAVSAQGQCLWIYRDIDTQEYYLHGYFD